MLINCPSGLTFQARKWRIGDRRNLHDQRIIKQGLLMRRMLEAVDEGLEDAGPYEFQPGEKVPWAKVCLTDIVDALIAIRIETNPELDYTETCENCGARIPLTIDLRELTKSPMSAAGKQHLSTGDPLERRIPLREPEDGETPGDVPHAVVKIRMLCGQDMPTLTKHYKQDPTTMQEVQMVMHLTEIKTPEGNLLQQFKKMQDFYAEQDWVFNQELDKVIEEMGGGMDTLVNMDCRRCNAEQQGILPFGAEFFYPRTKRSTSSMATL